MPWVTAMAACLGLRPHAKAFGCWSGVTYTPGFGHPARAARRSTMACSSGASSGDTSTARDILRAILPLPQYIAKLKTTAMTTMTMSPVDPPMSPPSSTSTPVRAAMSSAVLK